MRTACVLTYLPTPRAVDTHPASRNAWPGFITALYSYEYITRMLAEQVNTVCPLRSSA